MDIERTKQFILESQANAQARMDRVDARMDRFEARMERAELQSIGRSARAEVRMDRLEARITKSEETHNRKMAAILKLIPEGMKAISELTEAQKATDRALKAFIRSSGNGRTRGNGR